MNSKFSTKTIVATGLGAAVFLVLFMYVKIPSPVPETNLQIAYGVSSFFAAVFGPLAGFLVAFVGHALNDFISYGSPWWSWVFASGASALITGLCAGKVAPAVESGKFEKKEMTLFVLYAVIGNAVAWLLVAPVLDIVMYAEPVNTVFLQGITAFIIDAIVSVAVGAILLKAYASTKTGQGTLSKE
ncbi:MAG TPA: ECF-type riboflavin transporter substrate-binding protein [Erysipelotrichaceae bacterium]|nr:ECF-type riboflavin transporter substrate-binding protein [Erysipelotrichaceae bacterium]